VDILVASKRIVFEYQGDRHYFDVLNYGELGIFENTDAKKAVHLANNDYTLIEVPYWWDGSRQAVLDTLKSVSR